MGHDRACPGVGLGGSLSLRPGRGMLDLLVMK